MIINSIENRKRSGRYVKYSTPQAFCSAVLTCITNARPKCTQQAFHRVLVDYQKKRRKKATIQGHQILGCKYTPAKGMESCEKNEQCMLCCIVILFYYSNNCYYYYNYCYFFFFYFFETQLLETNFFTEALIQSN